MILAANTLFNPDRTAGVKQKAATVALPQSVVFAVNANPFPEKSSFYKFSHRPRKLENRLKHPRWGTNRVCFRLDRDFVDL